MPFSCTGYIGQHYFPQIQERGINRDLHPSLFRLRHSTHLTVVLKFKASLLTQVAHLRFVSSIARDISLAKFGPLMH